MFQCYIQTCGSMLCIKNCIKLPQIYDILCLRLCSTVQFRAKMKVLNVAEKNDAAKTLAGFLSSNIRRREGLSKYNKIYEFESMLFGQKCDMIMTSVSGHLLNYEFVGTFRGWRSCSPLSLFEAPVTRMCLSGYEDIKRTLEREIRKCSVLVIWTDCDREGENIGFEVIQVCTAVKPDIKIYRAKFSEITAPSVKRAILNLAQPDKRVSDAVEVRQELDLRIGAAFTRFQTLRLQQVFPQSLNDSLISYGSCQFPTLGFVVERYKAIENFIPESFWKIKVTHTINDLSVDFSWKRLRLFDKLSCQVLYDICVESPEATVVAVTSKPKSKWRPVPLDTIELEKVSSRKLRINAKEVMKIAEKLYTQGFISYPRTETNIFPKELDLGNLVAMQTSDPSWGGFASRVFQEGPNPRQGSKSDKAHPPIHPTKYTGNLSGNEQKVYEFIVRHFLACCSKDAEGHETIVEIDIAGEKFLTSGLAIIAKNYLEVYPYDKWSAKEIHAYQQGQTFLPNIEMVDGATSAPKPLTEADLIALMEKHGIGTDATHADHIETIKSRVYVGLENEKFFVPSHLGMGLVEGYDNMGFAMSKPNLRAELETDLQQICEGRRNPEDVLREQISKYKRVFEVALEKASKIDEALAKYLHETPMQPQLNIQNNLETFIPIRKCAACGMDMVLKTKKDGTSKYISCINYPTCKNAIWFPHLVEDVKVLNEACPQCTPPMKKLQFTFMRRSVFPMFPDVYEGCIGGCNTDLLEILGISSSNRRPFPGNTGQTGNSTRNTHHPSDSGFSSYDLDEAVSIIQRTNNHGNHNGRMDMFLAPNDTVSANIRPSTGGNRTTNRGTGRAGASAAQRMNPPRTLNSYVPHNNSNSGLNSENGGQGNVSVVCKCNLAAILLTVKKDGPNKGRQFYKCSKSDSERCDFFFWAESGASDNEARNVHQTTRAPGPLAPIQSLPSDANISNADIQCRCGGPAKRLIVHKEGPNKGRFFYSCPKTSDRCNFFKWADTDTTGEPSSSRTFQENWRGGQSTNRGVAGGGAAGMKKKRKCGSCQQEGHNKRNCPNS